MLKINNYEFVVNSCSNYELNPPFSGVKLDAQKKGRTENTS